MTAAFDKQWTLLAIDPGTTHSAYCLLTEGLELLSFGKIGNAEMRSAILFHNPNRVAIEMVASYGMPVGKEVFETVLWIGRYLEVAEFNRTATELIYRAEVKLNLCKTSKANDSTIRQAIIDMYGPGKEKAIGKKASPGPLFGVTADVWSALAIGITALAKTPAGR